MLLAILKRLRPGRNMFRDEEAQEKRFENLFGGKLSAIMLRVMFYWELLNRNIDFWDFLSKWKFFLEEFFHETFSVLEALNIYHIRFSRSFAKKPQKYRPKQQTVRQNLTVLSIENLSIVSSKFNCANKIQLSRANRFDDVPQTQFGSHPPRRSSSISCAYLFTYYFVNAI